MNRYKGKIYKTNNMLGKTLAQVVGNDPKKLTAEQERIEKELETFRNQLFGDKQKRDSLDSISNTNPKAAGKVKEKKSASQSSAAQVKESRKTTKTQRTKSKASTGGTVSVRRQRH
jgi:hypothetical protein